MCVCVYVSDMCVYIYICACICIYMCACMYMCMDMYVGVFVCSIFVMYMVVK